MNQMLGDGFDPNQCAALLTQKGFMPTCDPTGDLPNHCNSYMETPLYHAGCVGEPMYNPVSYVCCQNGTTQEIRCFPLNETIKDCSQLSAQDPAWGLVNCYCCCSCFAWDTLVTMADGSTREILNIAKGDEVLVASVTRIAGKVSTSWAPGSVTFSSGTGQTGQNPMMVYISYTLGGGSYQDLVCNPDQPFLMPDGKLMRAQYLQPGDSLLDKDGNQVEIGLTSIGNYTGGVHHIAVGNDVINSPNSGPDVDGHLILCGGLIAGDYDLQNALGAIAPQHLADISSRARIGTPDYHAQLTSNVISPAPAHFVFSLAKGDGDVPAKLLKSGIFKAYRFLAAGTAVPDGARRLFTPGQAKDILTHGLQVPISNTVAEAIFRIVKAQFAGFYPDITFAYDTLDIEPNLSAYEYFGQKYVVVSGGLTRMFGFNYEGVMMAMAWGIACFNGGDPRNFQGYPAIGQADLYAFGVISRKAWIGEPWLTYTQAAMKQWKTLFDLIQPENAGGNPGDRLNDPSIDCRWQAIESGFVGGALPECAGGPALPLLQLEAASASSSSQVDLVFSIAVTAETGADVGNYSLTPAARIASATVDAATGFKIKLSADLAASATYELKVSNLQSYIGTDLDPSKTTASFTTPK